MRSETATPTASNAIATKATWFTALLLSAVLDAPVIVRKGVWLVPETFMAQIAPRLAPPATAVVMAPVVAQAPAPAGSVALEDLRSRSYPSFTRIVVETSVRTSHRVESSAGKETRIRLLGLGGAPKVEAINDGFVVEARLERAGTDGLLRVIFDGAAGELRASTLEDPPRLVLDFSRPVEPAARPAEPPR